METVWPKWGGRKGGVDENDDHGDKDEGEEEGRWRKRQRIDQERRLRRGKHVFLISLSLKLHTDSYFNTLFIPTQTELKKIYIGRFVQETCLPTWILDQTIDFTIFNQCGTAVKAVGKIMIIVGYNDEQIRSTRIDSKFTTIQCEF